jgi:hypothetical protein
MDKNIIDEKIEKVIKLVEKNKRKRRLPGWVVAATLGAGLTIASGGCAKTDNSKTTSNNVDNKDSTNKNSPNQDKDDIGTDAVPEYGVPVE